MCAASQDEHFGLAEDERVEDAGLEDEELSDVGLPRAAPTERGVVA